MSRSHSHVKRKPKTPKLSRAERLRRRGGGVPAPEVKRSPRWAQMMTELVNEQGEVK